MRHMKALFSLCFAAGTIASAAEAPPSLRASDLLPPPLLSGPGFKADPAVQSDGYMTAFTLHSDFGDFAAPSREMLEVRVGEMAALILLKDISKSEVFAKSLGAAAGKKAKAVANMAAHPAETVAAAPASVGRFFKGVGAKGKKATSDAKDAVAGDEAPGAPGAKDQAEDAAKDVSGMSKARRQWAQKLAVDPYTTNAVLAKKLDDVAWAAYAGGFAMNLVTPPVVGMMASVNTLVWQLPPADIAKKNDAALAKMGVGEPARKAFFKNRFFTPTIQTAFVTALEGLGSAGGREKAVALATSEAESEDDARFFRRGAALLARYHAKVAPIASVEARRRVFVGRTASGALVVPAGFDYLTWTADVEQAGADPSLAAPKRAIWLSGVASEAAKKALAAGGWTVKESALD
jgi:hypothetical protein